MFEGIKPSLLASKTDTKLCLKSHTVASKYVN